jgi:hypothetical protein
LKLLCRFGFFLMYFTWRRFAVGAFEQGIYCVLPHLVKLCHCPPEWAMHAVCLGHVLGLGRVPTEGPIRRPERRGVNGSQ